MSEFYASISEHAIRTNWELIQKDPDFPCPEVDLEEFISMVRDGLVTCLGFQLILSEPPE